MKHKRFFSFITAMIMMFSFCKISPMQTFNLLEAKALTNDEITAKLTSLQSQYPSGSYWLTTGTLKYGGYQCYAFARQLAVDVFGSYPAKNVKYATEGETSNGWTAIRNASNVNLEPGDIIRADNDSHSAMIWKIEGNYVYVGQCWGSSNNMLNWGAFWGNNKKATISELLDSGFTGVWKHPDSINPEPHLDFSNYSLPSGRLEPGKFFPINGIISGYPNIDHVWGGVYNSDGSQTAQWCEQYPDSSSYNLANYFDAHIIFNDLPVGNYIYKIEATTKDGQHQFIQSEFQIGDPPPPISYYTVYLNANGGEVSPGSITVQTDGVYSGLPAPSRYGYDFKYWADESGREVSDGTGIYTNADHTLYANWNPKSATVHLNADGGSVSPDTIQVSFDGNYNNLPNPTREGYNFIGWIDENGNQADFNTKVTNLSEHTLIAKWSKDKFMITFNAMGGTVETANKLVVYDNKYGVLPTPERTGYAFKGWYLEESCTNQITSASAVNIKANQEVYAKWEIKKYYITFDANGGTVDVTSKQVTSGRTYGVLPVPAKTNSRFLGWVTADGVQITSSDTVAIESDTILYAKWKLTGDINADEEFSIADMVLLQEYLLGKIKFNENEYYAGDMNEDGLTDVFDMVFIRKAIAER